jgi:hypothetical protein
VRWQLWVSRLVARRTTPIVVARELTVRLRCGEAAVVPAGVDLHRFRSGVRAEARSALRLDPEATYALFPGSRANKVKQVELFEAAVASARRELPELQSLALEGLTRDQAALTVAAADVLVMTSEWEGSPVTVKEALACETPVVSTPVGDVRTVLDGLPGCSVCESEPNSLARGIAAALEKGGGPELRERAAEFARPVMARRVVDVYERVLRGQVTPP